MIEGNIVRRIRAEILTQHCKEAEKASTLCECAVLLLLIYVNSKKRKMPI